MTFTARILLAGAATAVIPLIIHLLNRSRHRKVQWGAMHLLSRVVRTNQRRLRVQQLILLALRCAFPAAMALALAGPVLTSFDFLPGDAPGRTVILVDNSYSLAAADPNDSDGTAFEALDRAVTEVLETQPEGAEIALVSIGSRPTLIQPPTLDRRQVLKQMRSTVHPDADPAQIPAAFQFAEDILAKSNRPRKTIILLSDFQSADWQEPPDVQSKNTPIAFYQVGKLHSENVSVEDLRLPAIALTVGQEIEIKATIRNFGPAIEQVPVFFRLNGDRVAASQVNLPKGGTAEASFQRHFDERGSHLVQIEVDVVDPLPLDNRQTAAIEVPEQLPVLVIDPSAHESLSDAEPNFLRAALTPFELDGVGIEDLIRATFITPEEFEPVQLFGHRAVILTNVKRLADPQLVAIDEFVRAGGGFVVLPGPDTDVAWFNDRLFPMLAPTVSWQTILPAPEPTRILREQTSHPVFEIFNETDNGDPSAATISTWLDTSAGKDTQILGRLASHPLMIESTRYSGRVLIGATDVANQWCDMADHPFFVPLVQRLVVYAATNTTPPRNVTVGQPLVALLHPKTAGETLELTDPAGHTHKVVAQTEGAVAKAVFPNATRPGPWTLTNPHGASPIRFAVQSSRTESELTMLTPDELGDIASELNATRVQSRADLESFERASRFGKEIWRPFLILALVLLFADVFLAQRFVRAASQP